MKIFALAALCLAASIAPAAAFASNPAPRDVLPILRKSPTLQGVKAGAAKEYGMHRCEQYSVESYSQAEGSIKAKALCTYTDEHGDGSGLFIQVEGSFWDNDMLIVHSITIDLVG